MSCLEIYRSLLLLVGVELVVLNMLASHRTVLPLHSSLADLTTEDDALDRTLPFPRWHHGSISFSSIIAFLEVTVANKDHFMLQLSPTREFPEVLYVVDHQGVWTSQSIRKQSPDKFKYRINPTEKMMQIALRHLLTTKQANAPRWESLQRAVGSTGFPFLSWYGDFTSCNEQNWGNHSIPLFTACADIKCYHSFPTPTYMTIRTARTKKQDWERIFAEQERSYPWESKIRKVVWRGSLTGPLNGFTSPRWRMGVFGAEAASKNSSQFDIGITTIPIRHKDELGNHRFDELGKFAEPLKPMSEFQRYLAILDTDGNSWSSRFGSLLCYNSIVLKVEPMYVDYFHFKYLQPWVHYVPVKYDLSDLNEQAAFVIDPKNEAAVKNITASANQWCHDQMVSKSIAENVLDIWDAYVKYLDRGDPDWQVVWESKKAKFFSPQAFDMVQI